MALGSGIATQFGIAKEVTPGTPVTVTRFFEYASESMSTKKKPVQGGGLRPDRTYDRAALRKVLQRQAGGDINLELPTKGAGLLLQQMLGSWTATATQIGGTIAYEQIHVPGSFTGKACTMQIGKPRTDGTVTPYTYPGTKFSSWELSCAQSDIVKLKFTANSWDELTPNSTPAGAALASASYPAGNDRFDFTEGALTVGGTASTTSGLTTVSGGVAVAAVTAVSIMGTVPVNDQGFFMGSATMGREQIQNAYATIAGSITVEFANTALYDLYRADTQGAIVLTFTGGIIAASQHYILQVLIPAAYFEDGASPQVGGPDILTQTIPFTGLQDDLSNPPVQFLYHSTDTTV